MKVTNLKMAKAKVYKGRCVQILWNSCSADWINDS